MLSFVYFEFYTCKLLYTTNCCYFVLPFCCRSSLGCTCPSATFWKNWKPSCPQTSSINCPASNHHGNFPNKGVLSCFDWVVEKNHVNFFFLNWTVYIYINMFGCLGTVKQLPFILIFPPSHCWGFTIFFKGMILNHVWNWWTIVFWAI